MKISNRFQGLFLIFLVCGLFYPAIFGGFNSVDDQQMVMTLEEGIFSWRGLFAPHGGFYYRPLLMLTFWFDKWVWGLDPSFMHLENILLHALNVYLICVIARRVFPWFGVKDSVWPFCAALLFAVHPVTTESVNWVSGRTDVLASAFVLAATLVLFIGMERSSRRLFFLSTLFYICGILSKEVMVFFAVPVAFLVLTWPAPSGESTPLAKRLVSLLIFSSPILVGVAGYIGVRINRLGDTATGLVDIFSQVTYDLPNLLRVVFKVFGFYAKKLVVPVPLNFAITNVSDLYVVPGVVLLLLLIWVNLKSDRRWAFFTVSCLLLIPAVIIAVVQVAWTPVAERYVYLPAAFYSLGVVLWFGLFIQRGRGVPILSGTMIILLGLASVVTAQRNMVWQNPQLLYQDTLEKSPEFAQARNELGIAMIEEGDTAEAAAMLDAGIEKYGTRQPLLYVNRARLAIKQEKFDQAREILRPVTKNREVANPEALKTLARLDEISLSKVVDPAEKRGVMIELVELYDVIFQKSKDPFFLYRGGQLLLWLDRKDEAAVKFSKAYKYAPEKAYYRSAAGKLAKRLAAENDASIH